MVDVTCVYSSGLMIHVCRVVVDDTCVCVVKQPIQCYMNYKVIGYDIHSVLHSLWAL